MGQIQTIILHCFPNLFATLFATMKIIKAEPSIVLRHNPVKGDLVPVKLRVTYDRKSRYYALGINATKDTFNETVTPPIIEHGKRSDNEKIASTLKKAEAAIQKISDSGKAFTWHVFDQEFAASRLSVKGAKEFIEGLVEALRGEERFASAFAYRDCGNSLERYKKGLQLNQIDTEFLDKYTRHLHRKLSPASVGLHLRTLRAIINRAIKSRIISKESYPFKGFKGMPSTRSRSKKALTKDQVKDLFQKWKKLSSKAKYSQEWQHLSLFLFSYLCAGVNLEDILRLTDRNLVGDKLRFVRAKTKVEIEIPLHPTAAEILADFSSIKRGKFLFPYLDEGLKEETIRWRKLNLLKRINKTLKGIAPDLGIQGVTFYSARHSFASILHGQGVATVFVGDMLGHTSESTTRNYLASIEAETKKEAFGKLL